MMVWLGVTVSKEGVGEETSGKRSNKQSRDTTQIRKQLVRSRYDL
jgi:hypothetical protein